MKDHAIVTREGIPGQYVYDYQYQTCFDDGGLGHESGWSTSRNQPLGKVHTDAGAVRKAKALVEEGSGKYPCGGSFCDNKGLHRLAAVRFLPLPLPETKLWPDV